MFLGIGLEINLFEGESEMAFSGAAISLASGDAQSIETGVAEELIFDTDDFDVGGWIDDSTNKRLKIPSGTSYVLFALVLSMSAVGAGNISIRLTEEIAGTIFIKDWNSANIAGTENIVVTFPLLAVAANEVYYISIFQNGGSTETVPVAGNNDPARFTVLKIG